MAEDVRLSPQTLLVLGALLAAPSDWRYGYDLSQRTGLKSGTLYVILMRLADREWLESKWEFDEATGRSRHLYRLTSAGRRRAHEIERERGAAMRLPVPQPAR